jgi:hypothetical protein
MKKKIPLLDVWLVTGRRLDAGYLYRYQKGYRDGFRARSAEAAREEQTQPETVVEDAPSERRQVA